MPPEFAGQEAAQPPAVLEGVAFPDPAFRLLARIASADVVEYLFGGHFSVGGEASYSFVDLEGESRARIGSGGSESTVKIEQKTNGTQTRLIFRYMF